MNIITRDEKSFCSFLTYHFNPHTNQFKKDLKLAKKQNRDLDIIAHKPVTALIIMLEYSMKGDD